MGSDTIFGKMLYLLTNYSDIFIRGIEFTLLVAIIGTLCGIVLAMILVFMKSLTIHFTDKRFTRIVKRIVNFLATAYIDIVRGTPMMVQAMVVHYGIPILISGMKSNVMVTALVVVSFNTAAYIAEIIRSGINGIGEGQMEAGLSLGMSRMQIMIKVIFPQALKNSLPALSNELIVNIKDSSVLSVIGFTELFYAAKSAASSNYNYFEAFLLAAVIYFIMTFILTRVLGLIVNGRTKRNKIDVSSQTVPEVR